jgi:hypothetical protein
MNNIIADLRQANHLKDNAIISLQNVQSNIAGDSKEVVESRIMDAVNLIFEYQKLAKNAKRHYVASMPLKHY